MLIPSYLAIRNIPQVYCKQTIIIDPVVIIENPPIKKAMCSCNVSRYTYLSLSIKYSVTNNNEGCRDSFVGKNLLRMLGHTMYATELITTNIATTKQRLTIVKLAQNIYKFIRE